MSKIKNRNVLITGGAAGIGKLIGKRCLEEGAAKLVIWDVNETALYETSAEFQRKGYDVYAYQLDVTDTELIEQAAEEVFEEVGPIDILINNAGIVVGKDFEDHNRQDIDRTMHVNVNAVMHITRVFLPGMVRRERGHIVNIASAASFMPNPGMSVYVASKWAVYGWSESLRLELERAYHNLHVTTVTPGFIDTGMFEGVSAPLLTPMLKPKEIVDKIIYAIKHNELHVREPWMVKLTPVLWGLLPPRVFDFVAGEVFKVYDSMSKFVGHGNKKGAKRS
jgi:all-trans-retinol dehydrogenase (NAD+)